jgi:hypothetical protein
MHLSCPRGISPGYFLPQQVIVSMFSQSSSASRSQHRPSRSSNAAGRTNTRNCFSAPEAVLSEVEQRFDCVQAQTHLLSESGREVLPLILNRILLLEIRGHTHSTDRMLSPIEELQA